MYTCESFSEISGWQCSRAPDDSLFVSSPVLLRDGTPLGFFLSFSGSVATFSDEGMTIFSIRNQGIDMTDRRNWRGLEALARNLGFAMAEDGEISMSFPARESPFWFGSITRLLGEVAAWQQERIEQSDTQFLLTREVEDLLRRLSPGRRLDISPTASIDGKSISFNFLWGDTYIDAIPPKARSTSSRLRKAIMARPLEIQGSHVLIIVDDRLDPLKAREEVAVLSQVAKAQTFTSLERSPVMH